MNNVFARALVALSLVAVPASAVASTKTASAHHHGSAKKDAPGKKKSKHHGHKGTPTQTLPSAGESTKAP